MRVIRSATYRILACPNRPRIATDDGISFTVSVLACSKDQAVTRLKRYMSNIVILAVDAEAHHAGKERRVRHQD